MTATSMTAYLLGSQGAEVLQIQQLLSALQLYAGPADGSYGGGTEAAVRAFQQSSGLTADGQVGPQTWAALFGGAAIPPPAIAAQGLDYKCLALTGAFETNQPPPECFAGLCGDFDGQGISFGAVQWNLGQGTLQPLLLEMNQLHADVLGQIFGTNYTTLVAMLGEPRDAQLAWARSIQDPVKHALFEPWQGQFKSLGRRPEFQDIQTKHVSGLFQLAMAQCTAFDVRSQRAAALMFDIQVQNGGVKTLVKPLILSDFQQLEQSGPPAGDVSIEVARLRIIATRVAASADPRWISDVQTRKLAIANGQGTVHGINFILEDQYGITLDPAFN